VARLGEGERRREPCDSGADNHAMQHLGYLRKVFRSFERNIFRLLV
jgi:hypothetical protein